MDRLKKARELIEKVKKQQGKPIKEAGELAALIINEANLIRPLKETKIQAELNRMVKDSEGKAFTTAFTDECFRSNDNQRIASQASYLLNKYGIPKFLNPLKKGGLLAFKYLGNIFPFIFVPLVKHFIRSETANLILPGEKKELEKHIKKRIKEGTRVNLNHLGEAILGEDEALNRLELYLDDLKNPSIEYISVKISTIFSQINLLGYEESLEILQKRFLALLKTADQNLFKHRDGSVSAKFVNLDMEEYKDLHLTVDLFKSVLDRPDCLTYSAGIVLQAYLPDSFAIQKELTEWALERKKRGGSSVKIRIVKGANLAMEKVEASLRGWEQAPYPTKAEVDQNFKRMAIYGLKKEHAEAVRIGLGSHNLFDVAYAILLASQNDTEPFVTYEMLEGMADSIRRVIQKLVNDTLLYCPAAKKWEFQNAVAYLVRRLDENTAKDNFLRYIFHLEPGSEAWNLQFKLFKDACLNYENTSIKPRRDQNRMEEKYTKNLSFKNEPDTDLSVPANQKWAVNIIKKWKDKKIDPIPLSIGGEEIWGRKGFGADPSSLKKSRFEYSLADIPLLEKALETASQTLPKFNLEKLNLVFQKRRSDFIGAMMLNCGKSFQEADIEVSEAIDFADYYPRKMEEIGNKYKPKGAVLVLSPWNFPFSIPAGGIIAALSGGNPVIFKPAKEAILVGWELVKACYEAGIPKEALQFVVCEDEPDGSFLVKDKRIKSVILTGATSTARKLMTLSPDYKLHAETGGKNGLIVSNLSDRDLAIKDILQSAFGYSGQKCSALSLLILHEELYYDEDFKQQLKDAAESLKTGSQWDPSVKITPLISTPSPHLLKALTTLEEGEEWLLKPKKLGENIYSPGIKWGVKQGGFTHQTEFFGPVLGVLCYRDLNEALEIVNTTSYGLTSGIHTLDSREIDYWRSRVQAGNLYVNRGITGAIVERQPFGGIKGSSFGPGLKAGGPNYPFQFVDIEDDANENYQEAWDRYFSQSYDPAKILGQDNLFYYVPRDNLILRIQEKDSKEEIEKVLKAAKITNSLLKISDLNENWEIFLCKTKESERVRFLSEPPPYVLEALSKKGVTALISPVKNNGRFELLHYVREVSFSHDYHRYGNLKEREAS